MKYTISISRDGETIPFIDESFDTKLEAETYMGIMMTDFMYEGCELEVVEDMRVRE